MAKLKPKFVPTLREVAREFGRSWHTVREWPRQHWCPPKTKRGWDVNAIAEAKRRRQKDPEATGDAQRARQAMQINETSLAKARAECELKQIEVDMRRQRLTADASGVVYHNQALRFFDCMLDHYEPRLLDIPAELAEQLPESCRDRITKHLTDRLGLFNRTMRQRRIYLEEIQPDTGRRR